ncbi:MAG: putative porin [Terriglobales bacterium]
MKQVLALALSCAMVSSAFAAPAPQGDANAAPMKTTKAAAHKKAAPAVTAADVQSLRDAIAAQQQEIEQLKQALAQRDQTVQQAAQQAQQAQQQLQATQATATDAQQKAAAAETAASAQAATVDKLNSDVADVKTTLTNTAVGTQEEQKRMSALEALAGRFRFTGDIRIRGEAFKQDDTADRNRARVRVRFGVDGQLSDDFVGGFAIATGSQSDPTTTNESLSNFFERKTIALDKGYITYNPTSFKPFSVTAGKWSYLWQRTSVTGDPDLNPEGFDEKLSFDLHSPVVKNFTFQLIQLLYNESSAGTDSYALGGQVSTKLQFGPWTTTPSFLVLNWNNPGALLNVSASQLTAEGPGCVTPTGTPSGTCGFGPNGITNATYTNGAGKAAFYSGFDYADFIWNNQVKTGVSRLPFNLLAEYEHNLKAADHPLGTTGAVLTNLGSQANEYGADFSFGQTKNKNDVQFGYAWLRQEQDSVLSAFAESDQRAPTNILQNRIYALWKLRTNTVASFTWWHGRTLNTYLENAKRASSAVAPGDIEPYLNRFQFDLIYSF